MLPALGRSLASAQGLAASGRLSGCSRGAVVVPARRARTRVQASKDAHGPGNSPAEKGLADMLSDSEVEELFFQPEGASVEAEGKAEAVGRQSPAERFAAQTAGTIKKVGELCGGKYEVLDILGQGSSGVTYKAKGADGYIVAIKELSLKRIKDWKQLEMFEREAKTLNSLSHPGIPSHIDYYEEETESDATFGIVQQLVEGKSLAAMIGGGWRPTEEQVESILGELLAVLQYLGSIRPPVIHRDIKPENIVIEGGKPGGRVFLIDFGGVQDAVLLGEGNSLGSTVVGTYGYMAPEQFSGAAQTGSDMYALGATLLFMLSGLPPSAFPQKRLRIDFSGKVELTPKMATLLGGMLDPVVEDRFSPKDAADVLAGRAPGPAAAGLGTGRMGGVVRRGSAAKTAPATRRKQPAGGRAVLRVSGGELDVVIPPAGWSTDSVFTGAFAIAWNSFVAVWTVGAFAGGGIVMALFSLPFWAAGYQLGSTAFAGTLMREHIVIGPETWSADKKFALLSRGGERRFDDDKGNVEALGESSDLRGARFVTLGSINGQPVTAIEILEGVNTYKIAESLTPLEQMWLVDEINAHIAGIDGAEIAPDILEGGSGIPPRQLSDSSDPSRRDKGGRDRRDDFWRDDEGNDFMDNNYKF